MGRPKSFEPDVVLDRAIDVFWEKGYDGASVDDLTRAMGINRFSMYSTFGDKHGLFLNALKKHEGDWRRRKLASIRGIRTFDEMTEFLYRTVDTALDCSMSRCGCVMVLTAVTRAAHDEDSREVVEDHQRTVIAAMQEALEHIDTDEGLREGISPGEAARFLATLAQGIVVSAAGGQSKTALRKTVRHAIDSLRAG